MKKTILSFLSLFAAIFSVSTLKAAASKPADNPARIEASPSDAVNQSVKKVYFISPENNATVSKKVTVKFGISGAEVRKAGDLTPGTGHHHLLIDGKPVAKGQAIAPEDTSKGMIKHFGKGQTETTIELTPGKHTLTMQFGDGAHVSYGEEMSATITVNVK